MEILPVPRYNLTFFKTAHICKHTDTVQFFHPLNIPEYLCLHERIPKIIRMNINPYAHFPALPLRYPLHPARSWNPRYTADVLFAFHINFPDIFPNNSLG